MYGRDVLNKERFVLAPEKVFEPMILILYKLID
jgi:hypothetical protein